MNKSLRVHACVVALVVATLSFTVQAEDTPLPNQSVNEALSDWSRMTPSSFPGTIRSVEEQCLRTANRNETDRLEVGHCVQLEAMLTNGECREELVADGIIHDWMNGRVDGQSRLTERVRKALGRFDRALICPLSDHIDAYWYTGDVGTSCNNVAFTFKPIPVPVVVVEKRYIEVRVCDTVPITVPGHSYSWNTAPQFLPDCEGYGLFSGGINTTYVVPSGTAGFETNCRIIMQEVQQ